MEQTHTLTPPQTGPTGLRALFRVCLVFIILYAVVWVIRVIMGIGPNLLMRALGASPDFRAYIGSTLNYGVGIVSYLWLTAIALRKVSAGNPWDNLYPFQKGWWQDLLFGILVVALILTCFFLVEARLGWLIVDSWKWHTLPLDELLRTAWVGLLVNAGVDE